MTTNENGRSTHDARSGGRDYRGLVKTVRPTLIAAIGGTGVAAAKVARSRIQHFLGPRHHFVAFRAFDTSFQDSSEPRLIDNSEYIYLGGFNAQAVISDIVAGHSFRHWANWLPPRLNFQQVAFGAGGIRPIGRLCYFYRRDRVEAAVREALTTATDSDLALQYHQRTGLEVNLESGIDIHLVCSVCGGTGSGMFLDVAYDLRRWAEDHTDREVTVTGHLVLPEAFRKKPVVVKALEANAFAALQELDHYMNSSADNPWQAEYTEGRVEESMRAPFDHCYLMSGLQQGGTTDVESLTSVIGEAITQLTLSQVGQKVTEGVINMAGQRKSTRDDQGRICCYSSYGMLGLEIPHDLLGEALGPVLARDAHHRLAAKTSMDESETIREREAIRATLRLSLARVESNIPQPAPQLKRALRLADEFGNDDQQPRQQLQITLAEYRQEFEGLIARQRGRILWTAEELRAYATRRATNLLPQAGGLNQNLYFLELLVEELRSFHQDLSERAHAAESNISRDGALAKRLEHESLAGLVWSILLDEDVPKWKEHLREQGIAELARDQAIRIQELIQVAEQELVDVWRRIHSMFEDLKLAPAREQESYYQKRRARTTICPLDWFLEGLEPRKPELLDEVLKTLASDAAQWANMQSVDLSHRFYDLCTRTIRKHYRGESGMTCDELLASCYRYPSDSYQREVSVFLTRANPNWELHESYSLRHNLLEISSIGVESDSNLYRTLMQTNHRLSAVDEQRPDIVPILRTSHGLSLNGLKRMNAYRQSLHDSVIQEQRYDFHFYNDRRWMSNLELADPDPEIQRRLYLFSMAQHLGLVKREGGRYLLQERGTLGRYRWEAYETLWQETNQGKSQWLTDQVEDKASAGNDWTKQIESQIQALKKLLEPVFKLSADRKVRNERGLSRDVYQIHNEIRALMSESQIEELGL